MGTPKKKTDRGNRVIPPPKFADKVRAINLGVQVSAKGETCLTVEVLEKIQRILLPLVEWLDRPLVNIWAQPDRIPVAFRKKRAVVVYDASYFVIALSRDGRWFSTIFNSDDDQFGLVGSGNSTLLAKALDRQLDKIWRGLIRQYGNTTVETFLSECDRADFLIKLFRYNASLFILTKIVEATQMLLACREERIKTMKERLALLGDLATSLDPIQVGGGALLTVYSVWENRLSGGSSAYSSGYLGEQELEPILAQARASENEDPSRYFVFTDPNQIESLEDMCGDIFYIFSEMKGEPDPRHRSEGRRPLSEAEIEVLRSLYDKIFKVTPGSAEKG